MFSFIVCSLIKLYISTLKFSFVLHEMTFHVLDLASECVDHLTSPCSCVLYQLIYHHWLSGFDSHNTHTQIHTNTDTGSRGHRKRLQADSLCHHEPNGDDTNGHDLIRQAPPPVKTCEMCSVINTFGAHNCMLLTCGAMGMKKKILNIKRALNMAITRLDCCSQPASEAMISPPCSQAHNKWFCIMIMKISFVLM